MEYKKRGIVDRRKVDKLRLLELQRYPFLLKSETMYLPLIINLQILRQSFVNASQAVHQEAAS